MTVSREALRAPALLTAVGALFGASLYLLDLAQPPVRRVTVRAWVQDLDGREAVIRYRHPVTRKVTVSQVTGARARPGDRLLVEADLADPYDTIPAGTPEPWDPTPLPYLGFAAVPLLWLLARLAHLAAMRRLARRDVATFAMTGVVAPSDRRRPRLDLFPLDATDGTPAVASVPLLTTAEAPIGVALPLLVKGAPRPRGLVVARWGDRVLWPAGRCAALTRRDTRLTRIAAGEPRDEVVAGLPAPAAAATRRRYAVAFAVLGATVLFGAVATARTLRHAAASRQVERHGVPVVVQVEKVLVGEGAVEVGYRLPGDSRRRVAIAPVVAPEAYHVGEHYPARVDPRRPGFARLDVSPYAAADPLFAAWLPAVAAAGGFGSFAATERRRRRYAGTGPWRRVTAVRTVPTGFHGDHDVIALIRPGAMAASCVVAVDRTVATGTELLAAGPLEPGSALALRDGDALLAVRGRAYGSPRVIAPVPP